MDFRWNEWNVEHIARHGARPKEAVYVVRRAVSPYPLFRSDEKWLVWGPAPDGRLLQVVFVLDDSDAAFVIHARSLTEKEKRRFRRRNRR